MAKRGEKLWIYLFLAIVLIILRFIGPIQTFFSWTVTTTHVSHSLITIALALLLSEVVELAAPDPKLIKIARYLIFIGTAVVVFFIFQDKLVAIGISLGIIAVAFTYLFQTPLLSIVGWVYLSMGQVYRWGDRIRIGDLKGDVISINPLRTKILEVGGEYVQADLPSGRLITFPNSLLHNYAVLNYTKYFTFIWVDIPFQLTYETDFGFVMKEVEKIVKKHIKNEAEEMEKEYKKLLRTFYVKDKEFSPVNFNLIPTWTWIDVRVTFPLKPHEQSRITTEVTHDILKFFKKHPGKVKFPRGRTR